MASVYTVGHSTRDIDTFVGLLSREGIELLIDVRTYPGSRFVPHFNSEAMRDWLGGSDIEYLHEPRLGGRRSRYKVSDESSVGGLRHKAFRNYGTYMQTVEFAEGLVDLTACIDFKKTAFMCSEALWWKCHRRMISDALVLNGVNVMHIMDQGLQTHKTTDCAMLDCGTVLYPGS